MLTPESTLYFTLLAVALALVSACGTEPAPLSCVCEDEVPAILPAVEDQDEPVPQPSACPTKKPKKDKDNGKAD